MAFISPTIPRFALTYGSSSLQSPRRTAEQTYAPLEIQAAKHVQFKAAKKADRCRPKKHRPSDIHRKPPPYNPSPLLDESLPSVYEIVGKEDVDKAFEGLTVLAAEYEPIKLPEEVAILSTMDSPPVKEM